MQFDIIDTGAHDGAWNMAFDVARAEAVDAGTAAPMLRFYTWQPWCISLGRHQKENEINTDRTTFDDIGLVRRPTGGRAILHAEELTYSVVMPSDGRGIMEVYRDIASALTAGLQLLVPGIDIAKSQPDFQKLYREAGSIPCFSSSARYEIEFEGRKLVGSAQRRIGSAVLQHGSMLIGEAHLRLADYLAVTEDIREQLRQDMLRHTITLNEVLQRPLSVAELRDAIIAGFRDNWGTHGISFRDIEYISSETSAGSR